MFAIKNFELISFQNAEVFPRKTEIIYPKEVDLSNKRGKK